MAEAHRGTDAPRNPGKPPLPTGTVQRVVDLALGPPPGETTHWTGRMLAKAVGVSRRPVQRILKAHQLAPHRIRTFKLSNDPPRNSRTSSASMSILPPMRSSRWLLLKRSRFEAR